MHSKDKQDFILKLADLGRTININQGNLAYEERKSSQRANTRGFIPSHELAQLIQAIETGRIVRPGMTVKKTYAWLTVSV